MIAVSAIIAGCGRSEPPAPSAAPPPKTEVPTADKGKELVDLVVEKKSEPAFRALMTKNGAKLPEEFELRNQISFGEGPSERAAAVSSPTRIKSLGKTYGAVCIVGGSKGLPSTMRHGQAAVFDEAGRLLREFIPRGVAGPGDTAEIISLGTADAWFVHLEWSEKKGPFSEVSEIYLIADGFPKLLNIRHHTNGLSLSRTQEESKRNGRSMVMMFDPDRLASVGSPGTDGRGGQSPPRVHWDPTGRIFTGPTTFRYGDKPIFKVVVDESHGFKATDAAK